MMKTRACVCLLFFLFVASLPARAQVVFFDDFTGADGTSLAGRVPPGGGGTWSVDSGSAVISGNRAHLLQGIDPLFPSARIRVTLDSPVMTSHQFQIRVIDHMPGAENVDIRAEETPFGFGAWRIVFDRAVGLVAPRIAPGPGELGYVVILPPSAMQPGTYVVTIRDVDFSAQTFAVDASAMFNNGGGVSASLSGLAFDTFPLLTVGAVAAVMIDIFEETRTDGVLIDDVRFALAPSTLAVAIDIKPGSAANSINLRSEGVIPVAVLSSSAFAAPTQIHHASLTFGAAGGGTAPARCHAEDVNADRLLDLVCHFKTQGTGLQPGDTQAVLQGRTISGAPLSGTDSVRIVPSR